MKTPHVGAGVWPSPFGERPFGDNAATGLANLIRERLDCWYYQAVHDGFGDIAKLAG